MAEPQVTPDLLTTPTFRFRGQRSRWRWPHPRLEPEVCVKVENLNLSEEGTADRRGGYDEFLSAALSGNETIVGLVQVDFPTNGRQQIIVTPTKVYASDGTTEKDITGATALTGGADDRVRYAFIERLAFLTNGVDKPRSWDGDFATPSTTTIMTGANYPFTACDDLVTHRNLLFAIAPTEDGVKQTTRLRWCSVDSKTFEIDTTTWPGNSRYEVYDGGPAIVGAVDNFGDPNGESGMLLVFKKDGLYPGYLEYRQGYIEFRGLQPRRGFKPISRASLVARPEFVFGVALEGCFIVDPELNVTIVTNDVNDVWRLLNTNRLQYSVSHIREKDHQVRVLLSSADCTSGHDRVMTWDWETGDVTFDVYTDTMNFLASYYDSTNEEYDWLGGLGNGKVFRGNVGTEDNGVGYSWELQTAPNDFGLPNKTKTVYNLTVWYKSTGSSPTITAEAILDQGVRGSRNKNLTLGSGLLYNDGHLYNTGLVYPGGANRKARFLVNRTCELLSLRLYGTEDVQLHGYSVEYQPHEG